MLSLQEPHEGDGAEEAVCLVNARSYNRMNTLCLLYMHHILKLRKSSSINEQVNLISLAANPGPQLRRSPPGGSPGASLSSLVRISSGKRIVVLVSTISCY